MPQVYEPEFKRKLVRLHLEEGRSYKSLTQEYGVSKSAISKWVELFSNECQKKVNADPTALNDADLMKENLRLRKELEEARKENLFLKKAAAFFAKEIDQRLIGLSSSIMSCLVCAGSSGDLASAQTHTITTGNTGRRIIMPIKEKFRIRLTKSITNTMAPSVIGA